MKLQLIAKHLRDDEEHVVKEVPDETSVLILISEMEQQIEGDRSTGSNWRYSIRPAEEIYHP